MKEAQARLNDYEWLSIVPAGGLGTRLGKLTEIRAKPSLAVAFDEAGHVTRMIDIPLQAIKATGGAAIVSRCFSPGSLDFISAYDHVETVTSCLDDSPIDTLLRNLPFIEDSTAEHVGLIPADANISSQTLNEMRIVLDTSGADAVLLASRHLEGHNARQVNRQGFMCVPSEGVKTLGDMGVHIFRRDWLLERLYACLADDPEQPREVWNDIYDVSRPRGRVYLYVPDMDLMHIDMGTPSAFRQAVEAFNQALRDANGNVVFPGARLHPDSAGCIALPGSFAAVPLTGAIIPEHTTVNSADDYLRA